MPRAVVMKPSDNVATCLTNLEAGLEESVMVDGSAVHVKVKDRIPFGHKFALSDIPLGEPVIKYAETIGLASRIIAAGEHVHIHNVESIRARGDKS